MTQPIRILHTSDWHLGQHFMGKTRQAEHQAFCDWLIEQVRAQAVDAVLIAGDIFDTGAPPSYAREQYNRFIVSWWCSAAITTRWPCSARVKPCWRNLGHE